MRKLLLNVSLSTAGAILAGSIAAWATNTTIGVTAGSGTLANLISFASTHVISEVGICDATVENQCAGVDASGNVKVNISAGLNTNGQKTMANSAPVVIASDQSAVGVTVASGGIASGGVASGAMVDLLTFQGTKAAGTAAANSLLTGSVFNSTAPTLTNGQQAATQVSARGGILEGSQYPAGSTPITISATGTTAATTATMATGASITTYICGFSIRANATAAATGNATVTGTITGTLNFTQWTAPLASGLGVTEEVFTPCVPASAVNTGIAVVSAAPGSGGTVSVTAWGYTL